MGKIHGKSYFKSSSPSVLSFPMVSYSQNLPREHWINKINQISFPAGFLSTCAVRMDTVTLQTRSHMYHVIISQTFLPPDLATGSLRTGRVVHSTGKMAASWTLWCYLLWPQLQVLPRSPLSYGRTSPLPNSGAISALTFLHGCETLRVADVRACLSPARWIC